MTFYRKRRMGHIERWSGSSGIPIQDSFVSEAFLEPDARDCIGQQLSSPGWLVPSVYSGLSLRAFERRGQFGAWLARRCGACRNLSSREALIRLHVAAKTGRIHSAQLRGRINHSHMPE
jgi:hypothetical protein